MSKQSEAQYQIEKARDAENEFERTVKIADYDVMCDVLAPLLATTMTISAYKNLLLIYDNGTHIATFDSKDDTMSANVFLKGIMYYEDGDMKKIARF